MRSTNQWKREERRLLSIIYSLPLFLSWTILFEDLTFAYKLRRDLDLLNVKKCFFFQRLCESWRIRCMLCEGLSETRIVLHLDFTVQFVGKTIYMENKKMPIISLIYVVYLACEIKAIERKIERNEQMILLKNLSCLRKYA